MNKVYLHTGLHKTATTFLQKHVFIKFNENELLYNPKKLVYLLNKCFKLPAYRNETIKQFKSELNKIFVNEVNVFISYEIMSGNLFSCYDDYKDNAEILKALLADYDVDVIVVLRYQVDWLISTYRESVHEHHYQSIDSFLNMKNNNFVKPDVNNNQYQNCDALNLDFYGIISNYQDIFNKENVHVLFFEDFKNNKKVFVNDFERILNSTVYIKQFEVEITNRGYSSSGIYLILKIVQVLKNLKLHILIPDPIFFFGEKSIYIKDDRNIYITSLKQFRQEQSIIKIPIFIIYNFYYKYFGRGKIWRKFIKSFIDRVDYIDAPLINGEMKEKLDSFYKNKNKKIGDLLGKENLPEKYME